MGRLYCSFDHASEYAARIKLKGTAKREKQERKEVKERKRKLLTKSDWIKKVQTACNAYVRYRDNGKKCVTCDSILYIGGVGGGFDAGHYRSRGSAPHLRFNTLNIHGQCKKCNTWGVDKDVYTEELEKRIGADLVEKLNADQLDRKYTITDLERLEKVFKRKLKMRKAREVA